MDLGAYLEKHGLTQEEFAKRLTPPVSQGLVWQWLNGRTRVRPERARAIERITKGEVRAHELRPDVFDPPAA